MKYELYQIIVRRWQEQILQMEKLHKEIKFRLTRQVQSKFCGAKFYFALKLKKHEYHNIRLIRVLR